MQTPQPPFDFHHFDPTAGAEVVERRLPHWSQDGAVSFITWRTWDSIPKAVLERFFADREAWLRRNGIDPTRPGWERRLADDTARPELDREYRMYCFDRWESDLDRCPGDCP